MLSVCFWNVKSICLFEIFLFSKSDLFLLFRLSYLCLRVVSQITTVLQKLTLIEVYVLIKSDKKFLFFIETGPHDLSLQSIEQIRHNNFRKRTAKFWIHSRICAKTFSGIRRPKLGKIDLLWPPESFSQREILLVSWFFPQICWRGPESFCILWRSSILLRIRSYRQGKLQLQRAVASVGHGKNWTIFLFKCKSAP